MLRARRACAIVAALLALSGCAGRCFHEAGSPRAAAARQAFAYDAWNESLVDGEWTGVDATLGQLSTDATHLRIVYGEGPADLVPVAAWIGRTRIEVLERR
jgi:hypothetical protein